MSTVAESTELREDAKLVIEVLGEKEDIQLDFSADSVSWLDTYIEQHRAELDEGDKSVLARESLALTSASQSDTTMAGVGSRAAEIAG